MRTAREERDGTMQERSTGVRAGGRLRSWGTLTGKGVTLKIAQRIYLKGREITRKRKSFRKTPRWITGTLRGLRKGGLC